MKKLHGNSSDRKGLVLCLSGVMFLFAISSTMAGTLMPDILEQYALSNMQVGFIGAMQNIGSIISMLLGIMIADRLPKLRMIILFFALYTGVLAGIGRAPAYLILLMLFLLLGMTSSYLNLLLSAFISEEYGENRTGYLNLIHGLFSLGSLAGPVYVGVLRKWGYAWNRSFFGISLICVAMFVLLFLLILPYRSSVHSRPGKRLFTWKIFMDRNNVWKILPSPD